MGCSAEVYIVYCGWVVLDAMAMAMAVVGWILNWFVMTGNHK